MDLTRAIDNIEYKIATESDNFQARRTLRLAVTNAWPSIVELSDALQKRYPYISLRYDLQPNDVVELIIENQR